MSYELISMNEQEVVVRMPIEQWQSIIESPQIKELSDEEISDILFKYAEKDEGFNFARAIEERHGIK